MNGQGQSDRPVVPTKSPNNAGGSAAEGMEGRGLAKGNPNQQNAPRAQHRDGALSALERVRQAAERDKKVRFTALLHHVYNIEHLRVAYHALKRDAAPGIDGETWEHYGQALEANLADLSGRLKRRAYRAKPVKRTYIPKADGRQRPLGIPTLEDKLVQRTTVEVLNAIYETDFLGFSYGFRPGRSPHHALDALYAGLLTRKVNWVLDADIRGFFEAIDHGWLVKFVEHRIACQRSSNNPHPWSLKIPHPPDRGGRGHERDIVERTGAGGQRHWPRGHTTRGGTHGPRGRLAGSAPAVPRRAAIEVGDRPTAGAGSEDGAGHSAGRGVAGLHPPRARRYAARRARGLPADAGAPGPVLRAHPVPGVAPGARLPRQLRDGETLRAAVAHGGAGGGAGDGPL